MEDGFNRHADEEDDGTQAEDDGDTKDAERVVTSTSNLLKTGLVHCKFQQQVIA